MDEIIVKCPRCNKDLVWQPDSTASFPRIIKANQKQKKPIYLCMNPNCKTFDIVIGNKCRDELKEKQWYKHKEK